jgi:hypothetical protein
VVTEAITIEIDCHAYAWHLPDPDYAECGPDNLLRMAETYGILIRFLPDHDWAGWAWWYEVIGPPDNIERFMAAEYAPGDTATVAEFMHSLIGDK